MFGHDDTNQQSAAAPAAPAVAPAAPAFNTPEDIALGGTGSDLPAQTAPAPQVAAPSLPPAVDPPSSIHVPAAPAPSAPVATPVINNDLLKIKQEALQALTPLVSHLEQSAEEKFRTTMMMIQATDDQSLIPQAYESAQQITDEKVRAQALLDVVNEINYFSQPQH